MAGGESGVGCALCEASISDSRRETPQAQRTWLQQQEEPWLNQHVFTRVPVDEIDVIGVSGRATAFRVKAAKTVAAVNEEDEIEQATEAGEVQRWAGVGTWWRAKGLATADIIRVRGRLTSNDVKAPSIPADYFKVARLGRRKVEWFGAGNGGVVEGGCCSETSGQLRYQV